MKLVPLQRSENISLVLNVQFADQGVYQFAATFGPVAIKSLYKAKAMCDGLFSPSESPSKLQVTLHDGSVAEQHKQTAIVQRAGLIPRFSKRRQFTQYDEIKNEDGEAYGNVRIPKMWGVSIDGDGESEGLNTFQPRYFSSEQISGLVIGGFEFLCDHLKQNQVPDDHHHDEPEFFKRVVFDNLSRVSGAESLDLENGLSLTTMSTIRPIKTWDSEQSPEDNFKEPSRALDRYLGIDVARFAAYPEWEDISRGQWARFIMANLFGLVVQWGTSGPAIYVMYYSPPVVSFPLPF